MQRLLLLSRIVASHILSGHLIIKLQLIFITRYLMDTFGMSAYLANPKPRQSGHAFGVCPF